MQHGSNIYKYAKKLRCHPNEIIDFSSNINFVKKAYNLKVDTQKYPEPNYKALKKTIAHRYNLKKNQIALFNGASSAIVALLEQLEYESLSLYAPLYGEYEKAAKTYNIQKINRFQNLYEKPKKDALVVFVNPSTPDGRYYDLEKLFKIWQEQNNTVILDESFLEFEELKSFRDKIKNFKKLYIIQSFSKFYGCAGVRIGAVFSTAKNIKKLKTPMWALSSFDVSFLQKRLLDKKFIKKSKKHHKNQKKELKKILKKHFKVFKSDANFFLVKAEKKVFKKLLKHKILTRPCGSFDFLDDSYIRFAVKDKKSHKRLEKILKKDI